MFVWYVEGKPQIFESQRVRSTEATIAVRKVNAVKAIDRDHSASTHLEVKRYQDAVTQFEKRAKAIVVSQIMSQPVVSLRSEATIAEARNLFKVKRFRHLPVLDNAGHIVGILSDRDILRESHSEGRGEADARPVHNIMKKKVLTTLPETEIRQVARILFEERIGCMPVINESGKVCGIVTRSDILRTVMNQVPLELWI